MAQPEPGLQPVPADPRAAAYAELIAQLRRLQDAVVGSGCDDQSLADVASGMAELAAKLGRPSEPDDAWREILAPMPSRGRTMCPSLRISGQAANRVSGTVAFGHHFLGRNGAAHGGAVSMLFDELFGGMLNRIGGFRVRTASLTVDFRRITPIDRDLQAEAWIVREEGRKIFVRGQLCEADNLCATADALFITLKPGQP